MTDNSVLVVVAHPDDDVLGFGGTAYRLTRNGIRVRAAILCGQVRARKLRPCDGNLEEDIMRAAEVLGMEPPILGDFPNIRMNTVGHLDLVQFVESAIRETNANRIVTTHPGDLNDDHRQVSAAAQAAARLSQRGGDVPRVRSLHYMEIPSATDWALGGGPGFQPDAYFELHADGVEGKLSALRSFRDVMRPFPHPRSEEGIRGLATVRGTSSGMQYAEAFQTGFIDLGATF